MDDSINKQGIALVVTLGFLSVLLILAISFSTFMRTERQIASSSIKTVQSELAALGALNRIIYDLNNEADWTAGYFPTNPCSTNASSAEPTGYECEIILSDSKTGGRYFLNDGVKLYLDLPDEPAFGVGKIKPEWYLLTTNFLDVGVLYSFLIVNESGLLDINHVSTSYPLYDLPYISGISNNTEFFAPKKGEYLYFYALPEIDDFIKGKLNCLRNEHFTSYLPFVQKGELGGVFTNRVLLGTNTTLAELIPALTQAGIPDAADQGQIYVNIMDYMDADPFSGNGPLGYGSEAVPMINEVGIRSRAVRINDTNYNISCDVFVELWYPFLNSFTNDFVLVPGVSAAHFDPGGASVVVPFGNPSTNIWETFSWTNTQFLTVEFSNVVNNYSYTPTVAPGVNLGSLIVEFAPVVTNPSGGTYDLAATLTVTNLSVPRPGAAGESSNSPIVALSVDDPRYNGIDTNWFITTQTMSPTAETNLFLVPPPPDALPFYVADNVIQHVGELGLVGSGNALWESIDICGAQSNLLDTITTHTNLYQRGLININAERPVWLLGVNALNQSFTGYLTDTNNKSPIYMSDVHLSNFTNNFPGFVVETKSALAAYLTNKWVMANSSDFYDVYGNSYTVIIAVKTFRDLSPGGLLDQNYQYDGPNVDPDLSKNILIAQFWRDPFSGETKLTFLKWQRRLDQ
ncbi:MAG: hypothetical protein PHP44_11465 [Kiritimatiellae bacterium]|nr:hypothetical protein [Kiritimatiellia bacterium]